MRAAIRRKNRAFLKNAYAKKVPSFAELRAMYRDIAERQKETDRLQREVAEERVKAAEEQAKERAREAEEREKERAREAEEREKEAKEREKEREEEQARRRKEAEEREREWAREAEEREKEAKEREKEREEEQARRRKEAEERAKAAEEGEKEQAKRRKEIDRRIDKLGNRFGELIEHLVAPSIMEKFNELGFCFTRRARDIEINNEPGNPNAYMELDILLENGDVAIAVEVKAKPNQVDIDNFLIKMDKLRRYADRRQDKRRFQGAMAGAIMSAELRDYILKKQLYLIEQTGDTVKITIPEGFKPREWTS